MPTGTVDFVTIIFFFFVIERISLVHLKTKDKLTFKEPLIFGVPTQIKIMSETII